MNNKLKVQMYTQIFLSLFVNAMYLKQHTLLKLNPQIARIGRVFR